MNILFENVEDVQQQLNNQKYDDVLPMIEDITKNSVIMRCMVLLMDIIVPSVLMIGTSREDSLTQQRISSLFQSNTNIHVYRYTGYFPNAFTLPNAPSFFNRFPKSIAGATAASLALQKDSHYLLYLFLSNWLINSIRHRNNYIDIKNFKKGQKINLNVSSIGIFYSIACINRAKLTERELDALLLHEVGHNQHNTSTIFWQLSLAALYLLKRISGINTKKYVGVEVPVPTESKNITSTGTNYLYFFLFLFVGSILFKVFTQRNMEYEADAFSTYMGYGNELNSALKKMYNTTVNVQKQDSLVESILVRLNGILLKIVMFISRLPIISHPHLDQRADEIKKNQQRMAKENVLYQETFVNGTLNVIFNICEKFLEYFKRITEQKDKG